MATAAARIGDDSKKAGVLYMALELGERQWKLGFTTAPAQKARRRTIAARDLRALGHEMVRAKQRWGLEPDVPVVSCYEAGRDGFWLHRYLHTQRVENVVVDSASIEVNRRKRRAKSDGLDVQGLLTLLMRSTSGERKAWSVVRVPDEAIEDMRQLHRELATLKKERTRGRNRITGLLATQGMGLGRSWTHVRAELERLRRYDGAPLGPGLRARLEREVERLEMVQRQIRGLERERRRELHQAARDGTPGATIQRLYQLRGIGEGGSRVLALEAFAWRDFQNRRQVGGALGLTPTPYQSGDSAHEQGISKAGSVWIRSVAIELAWQWVLHQPQSELTQWYRQRWEAAGSRQRRVGIVALARKLMIALWRYSTTGEVPAGARLKDSSDGEERRAA
jgi:transposase